MELLVDMNLSLDWASFLTSHGFRARHWSGVGAPDAPDTEIMAWARTRGAVVLTHDLDFGTLLALTHAEGPSVLQVRARRMSVPTTSARWSSRRLPNWPTC